MNHDEDERIGHALQALAPATRDPLFRIKVLERRERRLFRLQVAYVLGAVLAAAVIYAVGSVVAGGTPRGLVIGLALAVAATTYVPALRKTIKSQGK